MAVTKLSNSGIKTGVLKYDSMLAGNPAFDPAATWLIQRVAGTGSSATITFSSIPSTYQHLQIRWMAKDTGTASNPYGLRMTFNGVGGTSYANHRLYGDGTSATATGSASAALGVVGFYENATAASIMGVGIIDILDYNSTTKNKTIRAFSGANANLGTTADQVNLNSFLFNDTSAITSISINGAGTAFSTSSTFALYGIKGV